MATTQTIAFKGTFDASEIISSLKKIRSQMESQGADTKLFGNVDTQIKAIEKQAEQLAKKAKEGFSNTKDMENYNKDVAKLNSLYERTAQDLEKISQKVEYTAPEEYIQKVKDAQKALQSLKDEIKSTQQLQNQQIVTKFTSEGVGEDRAKQLAESINDQEKFNSLLEEERQTRQEIYDLETKEAEEAAAKNAIETKTVDLSSSNYKVSKQRTSTNLPSLTGNTEEGAQSDWKARKDNQRHVDYSTFNDRANSEATQLYQQALSDVTSGAKETQTAIQDLINTFSSYGAIIENQEEFTQQFVADLQDVQQAAENASTNVEHTFDTSTSANGINYATEGSTEAADLETYRQQEAALATVNQRLSEQAAAEANVQAAEQARDQAASEANETITTGLEDGTESMRKYTSAVQDSVTKQKEAAEAQSKIDQTFNNLKNKVTQILSIGNAWQQVKQQIQNTTQDLSELDASFASIAMVTDYSVSDMWSSYGDYAEMANELGQSTKDVIASSALFYQQGKPRL